MPAAASSDAEYFPQFMFAFFDASGEEVGDRVFALDAERAAQLIEHFPALAHRRAVIWRRYRITSADYGQIEGRKLK